MCFYIPISSYSVLKKDLTTEKKSFSSLRFTYSSVFYNREKKNYSLETCEGWYAQFDWSSNIKVYRLIEQCCFHFFAVFFKAFITNVIYITFNIIVHLNKVCVYCSLQSTLCLFIWVKSTVQTRVSRETVRNHFFIDNNTELKEIIQFSVSGDLYWTLFACKSLET